MFCTSLLFFAIFAPATTFASATIANDGQNMGNGWYSHTLEGGMGMLYKEQKKHLFEKYQVSASCRPRGPDSIRKLRCSGEPSKLHDCAREALELIKMNLARKQQQDVSQQPEQVSLLDDEDDEFDDRKFIPHTLEDDVTMTWGPQGTNLPRFRVRMCSIALQIPPGRDNCT